MQTKLIRSRTLTFLANGIELMPSMLLMVLLGFSIATTFLLIIGQFRTDYAWLLGLLTSTPFVVAVVLFFKNRTQKHSKERIVCNVLVLLAVFGWGFFNAKLASDHVITNRDPGVYSATSLHLIDNNNLSFSKPTAFGELNGDVTATSLGFYESTLEEDELYAQGLHLLPGLVALSGRLIGEQDMFKTPALFGVTALLALYMFARLIVRPYWAMIATGIIAASMPMIYFTRDMYTEPLALTFTFGSLTFLWLAQKYSNASMWFIAGAITGAGVLTRIDAYLSIAALLGAIFVFIAAKDLPQRKIAIKHLLLFMIGVLPVATLGWLDLSLLSSGYYRDLYGLFIKELLLILAVVLGGLLLLFGVWRYNILARTNVFGWESIKDTAPLVIALITFALIVRQFLPWVELDNRGIRTFAEETTRWVEWYVGPFVGILGALGIALAMRRVVERNVLLLAPVLLIGGTALVYLVVPSIYSDQIWASRRLLPVILPGLAIFSVYFLSNLIAVLSSRGVKYEKIYLFLAGTLLIVPPLATSRPLLREKILNQYHAVSSMCDALPKNSAVMWLGRGAEVMVEPTKTLCEVPSIALKQDASPNKELLQTIKANVETNNYNLIVATLGSDLEKYSQALPGAAFKEIIKYSYIELEYTQQYPPQKLINNSDTINIARW